MIQRPPSPGPLLFNPQNFWTSLLRGLFLLVPSIERRSRSVVPAYIIKIFDFVDSDDPVLAGEGFFNTVESWANIWQLDAPNSILRLSSREERVVVVVRHFIPRQCVSHEKSSRNREPYIKLFFIVSVAPSSTLYSPRSVKKSRSFTSSGQIPSAILTIHKNLLISSPE